MGTGPAQTPRSTRAGPEPSPAPPGPGDTGDSDLTQEGSGPASIRGGGEKVIRAGMGDSPGRGAPQRRHRAQPGRAGKYEPRPEGGPNQGPQCRARARPTFLNLLVEKIPGSSDDVLSASITPIRVMLPSRGVRRGDGHA
ncbi:hypothetical protein H8959_018711 [Pygathrix nigripes]